jgi:hypothetical protein
LILEDTALTFIPLLEPLLPPARDAVTYILDKISRIGRPREVVLALNEALQGIEERYEGVEASGDEGDFGDEPEDIDYEDLAEQCSLVIKSYTIGMLCHFGYVGMLTCSVIPRLPNAKSTPTLLVLSDALSSILPVISPTTTPSFSSSVLSGLGDLLDALWSWAETTSDRGGEQKVCETPQTDDAHHLSRPFSPSCYLCQ